MPKSPNFPITGIKSADGLSGGILQDNVYASGINDVEHSNLLSYKYPQYFVTAMLERIGRYKGIATDTFSWNEMDRSRKSAIVTAEGADATVSKVLTLDTPYTSASQPGYFIPTDVIRLPNGINAIVTAIGNSTTFQTITVTKTDGTVWAIGDVAVNDAIGHAYNLQDEYSDSPKGRIFLPEERYNSLAIMRRSTNVSGSALTNKTRLGDGKSWYYTNEDITSRELASDREIFVLTGQATAAGLPKSGDGILKLVENFGTNTFYSGVVTEAKLQEHIIKMVLESDSNEMVALCGINFLAQATQAMSPYHINGGISYGSFSGKNTFGLGMKSYEFLGKIIHFVHYQLFDDKTVFPFSGQGNSSVRNYSHAALFLDMGKDSKGVDLISLKYKEHDGIQRKLTHDYIYGIATGKGQASNGKDGMQCEWLSEIGVELRLLKRHGIMRNTAA